MLKKLAEAGTPEWHAYRRKMVTASRSFHMMDIDVPWGMDAKELAEDIKSGAWEPNEKMLAGSHFEIANLGWLSTVTGCEVGPDGALYARHEFMGASPDAWLTCLVDLSWPEEKPPTICIHDTWGEPHAGFDAARLLRGLTGDRILVEAKQTQSKNRSKWNKPDPKKYQEHYVNQCQHQMHVMEEERCLLICKVDSFELHGYLLERDRAYGEELERRCKDFWEKYLLPSGEE